MPSQSAAQMAEANERPRNIGRSAVALLVGFVVGVVLSLGTDMVLHAIGVFPDFGQPVADKPLLLATIYRTIYLVLATYITARLAPERPMAHALLAGAIALVVSTIG